MSEEQQVGLTEGRRPLSSRQTLARGTPHAEWQHQAAMHAPNSTALEQQQAGHEADMKAAQESAAQTILQGALAEQQVRHSLRACRA